MQPTFSVLGSFWLTGAPRRRCPLLQVCQPEAAGARGKVAAAQDPASNTRALRGRGPGSVRARARERRATT